MGLQKNTKIENIINEIKSSNYFNGDLSDLGNTIGIIVGKYISDDLGYEIDDFISGIKHGISLSVNKKEGDKQRFPNRK